MTHFTTGQLIVLIILSLGTTARLTRLVTKDTIFDPARAWIERKMIRSGQRGLWNKIDDLVNCPWCVSVWVSVPTALIATWHSSNRFVISGMIALTVSWLAANVQVREPKDEGERIIVVDGGEEPEKTD